MSLFYIGLYLLGATISYLLAKYFDWEYKLGLNGSDGPPLFVFIIFWLFCLPIYLVFMFGEKVSELGKQHRENRENKVRLRVAQETKEQQLLQELESELRKDHYKDLDKNPHVW